MDTTDRRSGAAPCWEHFPHGADVGVRGIGRTREQAFEQAAVALTAAGIDPAGVRDDARVAIECEAPDDELLLVDFLNMLVYEMATRNMAFARFDVAIDDGRLRAAAHGETLEPARHSPAVEVKGATYTALEVARRDDGCWVAQCVVDV